MKNPTISLGKCATPGCDRIHVLAREGRKEIFVDLDPDTATSLGEGLIEAAQQRRQAPATVQ